MPGKQILLVDDSSYDVELTLTAFNKFNPAHTITVAKDGVEALDFLYRRRKYVERAKGQPSVIFLDLKMPKMNGLEVLAQIKNEPTLKSIPVVILTSSAEEKDIAQCYALGGNAYVVKPVDFNKLLQTIQLLSQFWLQTNCPPPDIQAL